MQMESLDVAETLEMEKEAKNADAAAPVPEPAGDDPNLESEDEEDDEEDDAEDDDDDTTEQEIAANVQSTITENIPSTAPATAVTLRGEVFVPEATGLKEWDRSRPLAKLSASEEARRVFRQPLPEDETASLLNAMIGEMHFNMREVAFRSMCHATELDDRMRWVDASVRMIEAGARAAEAVAHVRSIAGSPARPFQGQTVIAWRK